jgi:signal transduction histidine kinase
MISIEAIDDAYILMILDDGPGMSPEQIEAAYGIGVRHDPSLPGTGLGLAIARDIAAAYGIKLALSCTAGNGLEAKLRLAFA